MKQENQKIYPQVGDHLYLSQRTGNSWVDEVKRPYTVIEVTKTKVKVQECNLIFNGVRYYDTLPDDIEEDPNGEILELTWAPKRQKWQHKSYPGDTYPEYAYFGSWQFAPYLN